MGTRIRHTRGPFSLTSSRNSPTHSRGAKARGESTKKPKWRMGFGQVRTLTIKPDGVLGFIPMSHGERKELIEQPFSIRTIHGGSRWSGATAPSLDTMQRARRRTRYTSVGEDHDYYKD